MFLHFLRPAAFNTSRLPWRSVCFIAMATAAASAAGAWAQVERVREPRVQADETFSDQVTVLEVEVPVQVFRDGVPVRGLERDDFVITYRGEEQEIVSFEVADVATQPGTTQGTSSTGTLDQSDAVQSATAVPVSVSRALLLLFDFEYQSRGLMSRSVEAARDMMTQLHPSDRAAVVALGGRQGARIITGFSTDRERTSAALDLVSALADAKPKLQRVAIAKLREGAPATAEGLAAEYGVTASVAFGDGLESVGIFSGPEIAIEGAVAAGEALDAGAGFSSGIAESFAIGARLSAFDKFRTTAYYAEALGNLGTLLSGVEGQKYAVLFSQGPSLGSLISTAGPNNQEGGAMVARAMETAFAQLVRAGWQIHTLGQGQSQAAGAGATAALDAYVGAPAVDAGPGTTGPSGSNSVNFSDGGNAAFYLATGTGGKAYLNATRPAVDQFLDRTSVTYLLRFILPGVPSRAGKEKFQVEVAASDVELQYRNFFYAPKNRAAMNDVERQIADARDVIRKQSQRAARSLEFTAHAFTDPEEFGGAWLAVQIPASQLTRSYEALAAVPGGLDDGLRLGVVAGIERGGPAGEVVLDQTIELAEESLHSPPPDGLTFTGRLALPGTESSSATHIRVAVELGSTGAASRVPLQRWDVEQRFDTGVVGPFFLPVGLERLIVRGNNEVGRPEVLPLQAPSGAELVPLPFAEVRVGEELGVMMWTHSSAGVISGETLAVRATPYNSNSSASGDSQATTPEARSFNGVDLELGRRGENGKLVLWFAPLPTADLAPGVYRIEGRDFDNPGVGFFRLLP